MNWNYISGFFDAMYPGIAIQAVLLTCATFICLLLAYRSGLIRATENFKLGIVAATGAIALIYLASFVLGFFGIQIPLIHGNGIVGKDDLVFTGGNYTINTSSHGIEANDSVRITGTTQITVDAGKDGIHCENNDDTSLGFIYISAGTLNIEAELLR